MVWKLVDGFFILVFSLFFAYLCLCRIQHPLDFRLYRNILEISLLWLNSAWFKVDQLYCG